MVAGAVWWVVAFVLVPVLLKKDQIEIKLDVGSLRLRMTVSKSSFAAECQMRHIKFREETRSPSYYQYVIGLFLIKIMAAWGASGQIFNVFEFPAQME